MPKELDFTAAWNDGIALLKAHREAAIAVVGVFIFLPQLVYNYMLPEPAFNTAGDPKVLFTQMAAYYAEVAPWALLVGIVTGIGTLAINFIAINAQHPNTGDAIISGAKSYLTLFICSMLSVVAMGLGLLLLILPGIYFAVKFSQIRAVIAAENQLNPIEVLSRSWRITKGNSLRIFSFLLIVVIVGAIAVLMFNMVFAGISLALPSAIGSFVVALSVAFSASVLALVIEFVMMGIYRQLTTTV